MALCKTVTKDSNSVTINIIEEECLGEKPQASATRKYQNLEPNSIEMSSELSTTQREPISVSRQNKKGTPTGLSANGNFEMDFTQNNWTELLQGVLWADKRAKPTFDVTVVTGTGFTVAAKGDDVKTNDLVLGSGFNTVAFNKVHVASSGSTATEIKVAGLSAKTETGKIQVVGHKFGAGDLKFTVTGKIYALNATAKNLTELGLIEGEWIFVGGDEATSKFDTVAPFYGRVKRVTANEIVFDEGTFSENLVTDQGAGKQIEIYTATIIKNEREADLIKRRSYTIERVLGKNLTTGNEESDYLHGAVPNEFVLNVEQEAMLKASLNFLATEHYLHVGAPFSKGFLNPAWGESGVNTSNDIRSLKLSVRPTDASTSTPLFAYLTELSLTLSNNLQENKALGVFGAIGISAGNFTTSGSITAYFATVEAVKAVRNNADVGLHTIFARANAGFLFDFPLVGLGGGAINVEKDQPITISLEANGAENEHGYTCMYVNFPYLPTVAM